MLIWQAAPVALGLSTSLASARAAYLWWRASKIDVDPEGGELSGVHQMRQDAWLFSLMKAHSESSKLNSRAARWSAFAAILAALAAATLLS